MTCWYEFSGNIHMHTVASDGTGTFSDLVQAAQRAGLDFLVITDHNKLLLAEEGWRGSVLVLVGEEVHDPQRNPEGTHLLCLGVREDVTRFGRDPQALIDAVESQGGLSFLAHPYERNSRLLRDMYPWRNWEVNGYTGIELWNYMSEFRAYAWNRLLGLLIVKRPQWFTTGPWPETLAKWDVLTQKRPVVALGGSDSHATYHRFGPWMLTVLPYETCFRAVNTHILAREPFSGDLEHDRALVLDALRQGHCWVGYDMPALTTGFRFRASQGDRVAIMGDTLPAGPRTWFEVWLPRAGRIRLLRDGEVIAQAHGDQMRFVSSRPGVYRVEVYRRAWGRWRAWIFSNPIYVR
ncbi:MAG: CehA/McbA family metallohydrolase [Chloroflexi bacterium]|nr:CehA/McbA family metallohydrolase [Chloroflexota bacterium]